MFLFINTTQSGNLTVVLYSTTQKIAQETVEGPHSISEKLIETIDKLLQSQNTTSNSLSGIIVATGPGSFTGLRIACAVANTLGQTLDIPLFGAPLSELDTDEKIILATSKVAKGITLVPTYDREANITIM